GLAVWRTSIGFGPGFFAGEHLVWIRERLRSDETFERRQPVFVVARAVVWVTTIRRGLEFIGQRSRPLFPGEVALGGKAHSERKGLGVPRLGEDRTSVVAGERWQRGEAVAIGLQVRHVRGSYPTCQ